MAPLTTRDDFGSSPPHTAVVIGIVAGVMIALSFIIAIVKAAARVPGSRLGSHVTPHPSGYESNNRLVSSDFVHAIPLHLSHVCTYYILGRLIPVTVRRPRPRAAAT